MRDDNVFKEARLIAMHCVSSERRDLLRGHTDECQASYDVFKLSPTRTGMVELVGLWTRMLRSMDTSIPIGTPDPPAGRVRAPEPQRVVA